MTANVKAKCNPQTREGRGEHGAAAGFNVDRNWLCHRLACFPLTTVQRLSVQQTAGPRSNSVCCRWEETVAPAVSVKETGGGLVQPQRAGGRVTKSEGQWARGGGSGGERAEMHGGGSVVTT